MVDKGLNMTEIDATISGIPCIIRVTHYHRQEGSYSYNAPSDYDYYGFTELDYDILDRKGYPAAWLERKLTNKGREELEEHILECLRADEGGYDDRLCDDDY